MLDIFRDHLNRENARVENIEMCTFSSCSRTVVCQNARLNVKPILHENNILQLCENPRNHMSIILQTQTNNLIIGCLAVGLNIGVVASINLTREKR